MLQKSYEYVIPMKIREYTLWGQCYKTFFVRNLRILEIS
jgi:hypothetical protein